MRALLLGVLLAIAVAAPAQAAQRKQPPIPVIGIGEQNPEMFASPYFRALGVKHVRVITAWDSLRHRWSRDRWTTTCSPRATPACRCCSASATRAARSTRCAAACRACACSPGSS